MATRTITSPGVEIRESDLSLIVPQNFGTNVFVTGYAPNGPLDEVLKITSRQELDQIYGTPTNSAERYFYYTIRELLNSPANIYTSRLPYGANAGDGFGSKYSALAYPVTAVNGDGTAPLPTLDASLSATYLLGSPVHYELTESEYLSCLEGTAFSWSNTGSTPSSLSSLGNLGKAGIIVLNKAQTTINGQFEGFYVGLADNTNLNPASNYDGIRSIQTVTSANTIGYNYTTLPEGTLQFDLTAAYRNGPTNSVSQLMENLTDYNIDGRIDDDLLNIGVFKLRKSIFATESFKLDYVLEDAIVGSIDSFRTQLNPTGGVPVPFFLETRDERSRNVQILVNDSLSNRLSATSVGPDGIPSKRIRMVSKQLITQTTDAALSARAGVNNAVANTAATALGYGDSLFALGSFSNTTITDKLLGDIPTKLDRSLDGIRNDEVYDIDVVVEAGLGTIYAAASASGTPYYDEFNVAAGLTGAVNGLRTSNDITGTARDLRSNYNTIFSKFEEFCSPPYDGGGRGDCLFVADVLRQILVTGQNNKTLDNKTKNFQTDIYWAIRHQFELANTSYAAVYGNWCQVYDDYTGRQIWAPFSGFAGAAMARTDAQTFPWFAPAGFTRGLVTNANDIAINPNQKQRDELYKTNINPVAFFPSQGQVIFGQKTLSRKPSAFDRINVRRLFQALERPTKKACKFFVFEPNTEFTRTRIVNTLTPLFEKAKNNQGIYDYIIVCDDRNNTPEVIDQNELVVDIYIKPVRTAEFILVNFYATRTDANFQELIGG